MPDLSRLLDDAAALIAIRSTADRPDDLRRALGFMLDRLGPGFTVERFKVAALVLAEVFRRHAPGLPYPLGLQLVTDEEVGGFDGTAHQIAQGVTAGFVIIGEQSGLRVVAESKGLLQVRLLARGVAAHAAYPREVKLLLQHGELLRKHGSADGRFYSARGVDAVIFGPGGAGQHGPDEYADITTIEPYYHALVGFLRSLAG